MQIMSEDTLKSEEMPVWKIWFDDAISEWKIIMLGSYPCLWNTL